jgi:hypothetical protein
MAEIALWRINLLRAAYLFVALGIAATIWPLILNHPLGWPLMNGVVAGMMAAVSVLAAFGLRYPLQMLPVLLFELLWKTIWLTSVALPLWSSGRMDPRTMTTVFECLFAVILIPLIPWDHVVGTYVTKPGMRWRRRAVQTDLKTAAAAN